jgi:hypothetical protein
MLPAVYKHLVHGDVHGAVSEALEKSSKGWSKLVSKPWLGGFCISYTDMHLILEEG